MKKIVATLLVILPFLLPVTAIGDENEFDFSKYTTDELIRAYQSVQEELLSRNASMFSDIIGRGDYVAGKTIAAGTYRFLCIESDEFSPAGYVYVGLSVRDSSGEELFSATDITEGSYLTFTLNEGDKLYIKGCSGSLVKIDAPSWMP